VHVLLVKMSSLGDVLHALPAVTDAASRGITFDWVVEEAFAAIPARHSAVRNVIPISWRRWRSNPGTHRRSLLEFLKVLRSRRYDQILDAQGLFKSGVVTALARGAISTGFSRGSAREGLASLFYRQRIDVARDQHAVDRLRQLFAGAFGYPIPSGPEKFGLGERVERQAMSNRCILLHGTTWMSKHWPESMWCELSARLRDASFEVDLPWGTMVERDRAERIAARVPGVRVLDALSLESLVDIINQARLVVGVDSGLTHLAAALGVPAVVLYGATSAALTGCRGDRVVNLQADFSCVPCLSRECQYRGAPLMWRDEVVTPTCYARLGPEQVWAQVGRLLELQE